MLRHIFRFQSLMRRTNNFGVIRLLYSAQSLGLDKYTVTRNQTKFRLAGAESLQEYINRVQLFLSPNYAGNIYVQDINMLLYLAEGTPEELQLIKNMLLRYQEKKKNLLSGGAENVLGPVVMRLLHFVNNPQEAYGLLRDPNFEETFTEYTSFQIAMNLTLSNQMYWETVDIFAILRRRFLNISSLRPQHFPQSCLTLCMAALYEINTPDSYQLMQAYLELAKRYAIGRMRRVLTFSAALAIRQNHPEQALHILDQTMQQSYITIRNLRILALTQLGEFHEALRLLRSSVDSVLEDKTGTKATIISDVFEAVKMEVAKSGNKVVQENFSTIEENCRDLNAIDTRTLDSILKGKIDYMSPSGQKNRRKINAFSP